MHLHCTTNPGLEDITAAELSSLCRQLGIRNPRVEPKAWGLDGHVVCRVAESEASRRGLEGGYFRLRSIYYAIDHLADFAIDPDGGVEQIAAGMRDLAVPALHGAASFRVSAARVGRHRFSSPDIERSAGAQLQHDYAVAVDLSGFSVEVRVDLVRDRCLVGVQLNRTRLDRRYDRVYRPRVSLRPSIAYCLLQLAGIRAACPLLVDPFCGSGTILLEAATLFPRARVVGFDRDPVAVRGSRDNAARNSLQRRITVDQADARAIHAVLPAESVDAIVTNPPFGIRLGRNIDFRSLYGRFLESACRVLKAGGSLVVLVGKRRHSFNQVAQETGVWRYRDVRVIETAGVFPGIFALEKRAR